MSASTQPRRPGAAAAASRAAGHSYRTRTSRARRSGGSTRVPVRGRGRIPDMHQRVVDELARHIAGGEWEPGGPLPAEDVPARSPPAPWTPSSNHSMIA